MSIERPSARITTPAGALTAAEAAVASVAVDLRADGGHDAARIIAHQTSRLAALAVGAPLAIALGDAGREEDVFGGRVTWMTQATDGVLVEALALTAALSATRRAETYVGQRVADIVRDLAGAVPIDEVQGDLTLAAYAVDDRRSVWEHLRELARLAGAELSAAATGGLRFVPVAAAGSADHTFRFGVDLLGHDVARRTAPGAARVAPAADQSQGEWHWLARAPLPAGGGAGPVHFVPAFRTRAGADGLAAALAGRATRSAWRVRLRLRGNARLRPGQRVALEDLPGGAVDPLRLTAVQHRLGAGEGFVSEVFAEGAGSGGFP